MIQNSETKAYQRYLQDGGEMGELTRNFNWSETPLGHPENWPQSLLTTLSIVLNSKFPMFLWWGPELIQFYNDAYRPSLGVSGKHPEALGQRAEDCWPEIWSVIKPLIDQVMSGGESTWSEDQLIPIYRNNRLEDVYWTFSYTRVIDDSGSPAGVLVVCNETTTKVQAHLALEQATKDLELAKAETENQRDRLKRFFMQAPAGICILDGPDLVFELINPSFQQLFPERNLLGKPILEAIPEIKQQSIHNILQSVYQTGKTFEGNELIFPFAHLENDTTEDRYFNFIYQPRYNYQGKVDGLLIFVFEVTEMVIARKRLQQEQDKLKLCVRAAELGTFDIDIEKGTMEWDERCRALFGISHKNPVTYEKDFVDSLHPEDRDRITAIIDNAFKKSVSNGDYDVEYRTIGFEDNKLRWVRAKGKAYFDKNDRPVRFIGTVIDITEQKLDELRKNDFIAMVSHELKTPLTSLTAYVQLLHNKAVQKEDMFTADALSKVNQQVKKMSSLINGFLNISRLESGKIHLNIQYFNLCELISDIIEEIKLISGSHTITMSLCNSLHLHADRDKIGSVISNLLSNAAKYSDKGKTIEVKCRQVGNMAEVSVKDEGKGIPPKDIGKLFERYYRVETPDSSHISGFGIGLYLSAEIIQRHHGKIWVESEVGKGSIFYFTLPLTVNNQQT